MSGYSAVNKAFQNAEKKSETMMQALRQRAQKAQLQERKDEGSVVVKDDQPKSK